MANGDATVSSNCRLNQDLSKCICRNYGCKKKLADGDVTVCLTCVSLCRTYRCKKNLADGDATLCSDCRLKRDLAKLIIIPNEGLIMDPNENNVLCGRGIRIDGQVGNVQFRKIIHSKKSEYLASHCS